MPTRSSLSSAVLSEKAPVSLALQGFSYYDPQSVLPSLAQALWVCGCRLRSCEPIAAGRTELRFELPVEAALDIYAALLEFGLELTRSSHLQMTALCTLRQHGNLAPRAARSVRLQVRFLCVDQRPENQRPERR
jgi:hypothetical protein